MTKSERKKVNRDNAARSTGPKTIEGKQSSRSNALVHGYRAKNIEVLIPDADERAARLALWNEAYDPANPVEEAHVHEAVIAEYKLHAASAALDSVIADQLKDIDDNWDSERLDLRDDLIQELPLKPAHTLRELATFAAGAAWVRDAWLDLQKAFHAHGQWLTHEAIDRALVLSGYDPDGLKDAPSADGFVLMVLAYSCWEYDEWKDDEDLKLRYLRRMPTVWQATVPFVRADDTARARADLVERIAREVASWEAKLAAATKSEAADRAHAVARAHAPLDAPGNALLLRYTSAASCALNRAMNGLQKAQKEREQAAEKAARANEANEARRPPLDAEPGKSYVDIGGRKYSAHPIGDGQFTLIPASRTGPGVVCHEGVVCDPVEPGPETGS